MKATINKNQIIIEANWSKGDIENTQKTSTYMQENLGYKLVEGDDNPEEYYEILCNMSITCREIREDYNIAKEG